MFSSTGRHEAEKTGQIEYVAQRHPVQTRQGRIGLDRRHGVLGTGEAGSRESGGAASRLRDSGVAPERTASR